MNTFACTNCGLPNQPSSAVCARCGSPFQVTPAVQGRQWAPQAPAPSGGRSTAVIVAVVVGVVAVGIVLVGIVAAIAIPSLIRARGAANEAAAIDTLRVIALAEVEYFDREYKYGTLAELGRAGVIDPSLTNGAERGGYVFRDVKVSDDTFEFSAEPSEKVAAGGSAYNVTEDFVVRVRKGRVAPVGRSGTPVG